MLTSACVVVACAIRKLSNLPSDGSRDCHGTCGEIREAIGSVELKSIYYRKHHCNNGKSTTVSGTPEPTHVGHSSLQLVSLDL